MPTSERLALALKRSGFSSIHAFKVALILSYPDVKGGSYSSVHSYFKGVDPPLEFLIAAAEVLHVRLVWLRTGEGSIEDQTPRESTAPDEEGWLDVLALFNECTEGDAWFQEQAGDLIIVSWFEATKTIVQSCRDYENAGHAELVAIGTWLHGQATGLLATLNPADRAWTGRDFHGCFNLLFQALANMAPYANQGRTVEELIQALKAPKKRREGGGR